MWNNAEKRCILFDVQRGDVRWKEEVIETIYSFVYILYYIVEMIIIDIISMWHLL